MILIMAKVTHCEDTLLFFDRLKMHLKESNRFISMAFLLERRQVRNGSAADDILISSLYFSITGFKPRELQRSFNSSNQGTRSPWKANWYKDPPPEQRAAALPTGKPCRPAKFEWALRPKGKCQH